MYICKRYLGIRWIRSGIKQHETKTKVFLTDFVFRGSYAAQCLCNSTNLSYLQQIFQKYQKLRNIFVRHCGKICELLLGIKLYATLQISWFPVFLINMKQCIVYNSARWELIKFVNTFRLLGHFSQRKEQQKWSKNNVTNYIND